MNFLAGVLLLLEVNTFGGVVPEPAKDVYVISVCSPTMPHKGSWSYTFERGNEVLILNKGYCFAT